MRAIPGVRERTTPVQIVSQEPGFNWVLHRLSKKLLVTLVFVINVTFIIIDHGERLRNVGLCPQLFVVLDEVGTCVVICTHLH